MDDIQEELQLCCGTVADKAKLCKGFEEMAQTIRAQNLLIGKLKREIDQLRAEKEELKDE